MKFVQSVINYIVQVFCLTLAVKLAALTEYGHILKVEDWNYWQTTAICLFTVYIARQYIATFPRGK